MRISQYAESRSESLWPAYLSKSDCLIVYKGGREETKTGTIGLDHHRASSFMMAIVTKLRLTDNFNCSARRQKENNKCPKNLERWHKIWHRISDLVL